MAHTYVCEPQALQRFNHLNIYLAPTNGQLYRLLSRIYIMLFIERSVGMSARTT